jgi:hypothetical protein
MEKWSGELRGLELNERRGEEKEGEEKEEEEKEREEKEREITNSLPSI